MNKSCVPFSDSGFTADFIKWFNLINFFSVKKIDIWCQVVASRKTEGEISAFLHTTSRIISGLTW